MGKESYQAERKILCEIGKLIYQHGWVASNDGNLSIRLGENDFLITPTGVSKGFLDPDQLIRVNLQGIAFDGRENISTEWKMHKVAYENRPDIGGVVHTHSPYATAFAVAGLALDRPVVPELIFAFGGVPLVPYYQPGSGQLYDGMLPFVHQTDAFLLQNHGLVTFGKDLWDAFLRHEAVEHAARIEYLARQIGNISVLTREQVMGLKEARDRAGITSPWYMPEGKG